MSAYYCFHIDTKTQQKRLIEIRNICACELGIHVSACVCVFLYARERLLNLSLSTSLYVMLNFN